MTCFARVSGPSKTGLYEVDLRQNSNRFDFPSMFEAGYRDSGTISVSCFDVGYGCIEEDAINDAKVKVARRFGIGLDEIVIYGVVRDK